MKARDKNVRLINNMQYLDQFDKKGFMRKTPVDIAIENKNIFVLLYFTLIHKCKISKEAIMRISTYPALLTLERMVI